MKYVVIFSDVDITAKTDKVTASTRLSGVIFMLTDTMSSRKDIFEKAIRYKPNIPLLIETRMDLIGGRIYTINPCDLQHIRKYEETLYSDEESAVSACGTSQSIVSTAIQIASTAVWQMINWHNENKYNNEILIDCQYNNILTQRWE